MNNCLAMEPDLKIDRFIISFYLIFIQFILKILAVILLHLLAHIIYFINLNWDFL